MIKVGSNTVTFPYSKIYVGDTKVWEAQAPGPSQYLNYIESTGTQYIDPNAENFDSGDSVEVDFQLTDDTQGSSTVLFGTVWSGYPLNPTTDYKYTGAGTRYWRSGRRSEEININTPDTLRHTLKYNLSTHTITFDGVDTTYSQGNTSFGYIFAYMSRTADAGGTVTKTALGNIKAKIYSFKVTNIYAQTTLELVPVLDGNGVPCMWDTVSQTFFYNQGTGDFLYG